MGCTSLVFGKLVYEKALTLFQVVCKQRADVGKIACDNSSIILCVKESNGMARLISPAMGPNVLGRMNFFEVVAFIDRFGTGKYRVQEIDFEFFLLGRRDSSEADLPHNVFMSLCAVTSAGRCIETAELQVNMLGQITLVNCFKASMPEGVVLDEKSVGLISGQDSWVLNRLEERIELRLPSQMKMYTESRYRGKVFLKAVNQGMPVVLSKSESRLHLLRLQSGKRY